MPIARLSQKKKIYIYFSRELTKLSASPSWRTRVTFPQSDNLGRGPYQKLPIRPVGLQLMKAVLLLPTMGLSAHTVLITC